ncbi:MAG TPA: 50S ribosomal protein L15 [Smithellaceae bacterium]|jgi:large subunit ribosomal protein L15|nr:50S ribosomal protein L15 [Syntrophaceae bacterium]HPL97830.1 50S ribosomal protein L15 [Smithellaceae bacterium]HPV48486.1 50S ribosomal protein L15 [Smithellaceae bacterium]HQF84062.1 50S ribosomal protein L15 [Smithellaceae bacterium]HQG80371.1 50S ribosomal protein L15 [Smithellaceae bacterium]
MDLSSLKAPAGASRKRKRLGRGNASGHGGTSGKGHKGQKSRSGGGVRDGFEGGQMPMARRLPKRGFRNPFRQSYVAVNLSDLSRVFTKDAVIDEAAIVASGLVKKKGDGIKILAKGEINFPVTVKMAKISMAAKTKITAAGGTVEEVI